MTQREKLIDRLRQHPNSATLEELERVLHMLDFKLVRTRGSHHIYRQPGGKIITVARHGSHVNSEAVREVLRLVDERAAES